MEAAKRANIHDYIMSLEDGYNTVIGELGVRLSVGQKQRLGFEKFMYSLTSIERTPELCLLRIYIVSRYISPDSCNAIITPHC